MTTGEHILGVARSARSMLCYAAAAATRLHRAGLYTDEELQEVQAETCLNDAEWEKAVAEGRDALEAQDTSAAAQAAPTDAGGTEG